MADKLKILVVDDDPIVKDIVSNILESTGKYHAIQAEDGEVALAHLVADQSIRLVITDVNMPKMDGFALLNEVRKTDSQTPFIILTDSFHMLSGSDTPDTGTDTPALRMTDYLAKDESFQEAIIPLVEKALR